jgi:hypothetical protein
VISPQADFWTTSGAQSNSKRTGTTPRLMEGTTTEAPGSTGVDMIKSYRVVGHNSGAAGRGVANLR